MTINWSAIELVVFDVDGTLYNQRQLRRSMAVALVRASLEEKSLKTICILRAFRRIAEQRTENSVAHYWDMQFRQTADACDCTEAEVRHVVARWIDREPLGRLSQYKVVGVDRIFSALNATGRRVAVWSDYPVADKLDALGLKAELQVWSGQKSVGRPKPDPSGLALILAETGARPNDTLMIGDRFDRDWEAAKTLSVPTLIRARRKDKRAPTFWNYHDPLFSPLIGNG